MNAGDDDFIIPPPGIVLEPARTKPVEPEPLDVDRLITLPPGILDSATYRLSQQPTAEPDDREDVAPVFLPSAGIGAPVAAWEPESQEIDDATRASVGRRRAPAWRLTLPDAEQVLVEQTTLVGRDPARDERWPDALLLPMTDIRKTVSKTHAALELTASGQLIVHDLDSTNGVYVTAPDGEGSEVLPGTPVLVDHGAEVSFGEFTVIVERP